jgi:hypothetical protein
VCVLANHTNNEDKPAQPNDGPAGLGESTGLSDVIPGERETNPNPIHGIKAATQTTN